MYLAVGSLEFCLTRSVAKCKYAVAMKSDTGLDMAHSLVAYTYSCMLLNPEREVLRYYPQDHKITKIICSIFERKEGREL